MSIQAQIEIFYRVMLSILLSLSILLMCVFCSVIWVLTLYTLHRYFILLNLFSHLEHEYSMESNVNIETSMGCDYRKRGERLGLIHHLDLFASIFNGHYEI